MQLPGTALTIASADLAEAANASEALRRELFFQDRFILAQAQQSAACNARHDITQRLATWLLRVRERAQQDDLGLTQEFLSQMIGVQRPSISLAASQLQEGGIISYRRGMIRILDPKRLESVACECFASLRAQRADIGIKQDIAMLATPPPLVPGSDAGKVTVLSGSGQIVRSNPTRLPRSPASPGLWMAASPAAVSVI